MNLQSMSTSAGLGNTMSLIQMQLQILNVTEMSVDQTFVIISCEIFAALKKNINPNRPELCESHLAVKMLTVITKIWFSYFYLKIKNCFLEKSSFDISAEIWCMI